MAAKTQLQSSRFELKYLIEEPLALEIARFVRGYLEPDEYAAKSSTYSYRVKSLYLDSRSYTLYRQTCQGAKNRFKLRIRFYDEEESSPCFLEIKRRELDVIKKERTPVTRKGAGLVANGMTPSPSFLYAKAANNGKALQSLWTFCELRDHTEAVGKTYVSYEREAYMSPDGSQIRVTFDRDLRGAPYVAKLGVHVPDDAVCVDPGGVILELKFSDRFPAWMRELVQIFNLQRCSVPKYVDCLEATQIQAKLLAQAKI